jgi:hypothetical protein
MSKRAIEREQGTIETGGKETTPGARRHKPEDVREFVTLCVTCFSFDLASRQTQEILKINKQKKWEEKGK